MYYWRKGVLFCKYPKQPQYVCYYFFCRSTNIYLFIIRLWISQNVHEIPWRNVTKQQMEMHPCLNHSNYMIIPIVYCIIQDFSVMLESIRTLFNLSIINSIRVVVYYMDAVSTYTVSSELSFQVVKPFSLAFTRYQLSNTSYLINSTITNNLSKPLTITNISIYNMASFVKESYNSFNEYCFCVD